MYGWKTRLGIAVPSANAVMEPEFNQMCPEGVTVHFARMWLKADTEEQILGLYDKVKDAVEMLAHVEPSVISFGCTAGSLIKGMGYDRDIIRIISEAAGVKATTTSTAVIEALGTLGVRKVAVGTPYEDWLNARVRSFLEANGFLVTSIVGLGIISGPEIAGLPAARVYDLARKAFGEGADGVFLSCTGLPTVRIIEDMEEDFGVPVISSNQATFWHMLRLAGLRTRVPGFGSLLDGG
ncbi:MAG: aspartate/glutamate racemase family protein [Firmicutes bacterium]|nr:aspartate/glutamate racemase family protein [Bacillota bacterium]